MLSLILTLLLQTGSAVDPKIVAAPHAELQSQPETSAPSDLEAIVSRIRLAIDTARYDEADALLRSYQDQLAPAHREDFTVLQAELILAQGDPRAAEKATAGLDPEGRFRCQILRIGGMVAYARGDADRSVAQLGTLAHDCSATWREWGLLGQLLADQGERDASRFAFENAMASRDYPPAVSADYGHSLIQFGLLDEASAMLTQTLQRDPANSTAQRDQDYLTGIRGREPRRRDREGDAEWARRLADAADGARHAGNRDLARALYAQALIASPQYDARLLEAVNKP